MGYDSKDIFKKSTLSYVVLRTHHDVTDSEIQRMVKHAKTRVSQKQNIIFI